MKKSFILVLLAVIPFITEAQLSESFMGNWLNTETNDWEYGFFEDFAVYDCEFWNYSQVSAKGKTTIIDLRRNNDEIRLEIKKDEKKGTLSIRNNKMKAQTYTRATDKRYPDYPVKDETPFPEPGFIQDSVTINGYYRNFNKIPESFKELYGYNYFELSVSDIISQNTNDHLTSIDSMGRFSITIPVVSYQQAWVDWKRVTTTIVLPPSGKIFLFAELTDFLPRANEEWWDRRNRHKELLFMGSASRLNNELISYKAGDFSFNLQEEVKNGSSDLEILQKRKAAFENMTLQLEEYIRLHPTVSEQFIEYNRKEYLYGMGRDLMQHYFNTWKREIPKFEEGYMEFVNSRIPLFDPKAYILIRDYNTFITDYIGYAKPRSQSVVIGIGKIKAFLLESGLFVDEETKQLLDQFEQFDTQLRQLTDSAQRADLAATHSDIIAKLNDNTIITGAYSQMVGNAFFDAEQIFVDSILTEPIINELYTARLFYRFFDNQRLPMNKPLMNTFDKRIHMPFIRHQLLSMNDYYASVQSQKITDLASLKNTDHMKDMYNPEEIFQQLLREYKDKVVYLDVWGTWCQPCRENMKMMVDVKEQLKDKDIIFMYLANNSPQATWESVIKEMNLTGNNIVHYRLPGQQQDILEKWLSVRQYPTYMIIDKEGKIVNKDAPSPRNIPALMQEIEKYM